VADLTHDSDDAFHEIQLSGKQLVFLFMATTVVSVVIFLCGVLVGRSVRAENLGADPVMAAAPDEAAASEPLGAEPRSAEPPDPAPEAQLTYRERLDAERPTESEKLTSRSEAASKPAEAPAPRAATPAAEEAKPAAAAERRTEPPVPPASAQGARPGTWIVQVISLKDRAAANQIVQRLKNKGYPAFLAVTSGAPTQLYKVQVGRYRERAEAQKIQARLKREEQFDSLIVR
jgi:DedD protein